MSDGPLAPDLLRALADFARRPRVLVALDFDGCLAPLVEDPARARPTERAAAALAEFGRMDDVHLALVSGRPAADLVTLADPPAGTRLIGSHGAERARLEGVGVAHEPFTLTDAQRELLERVSAAAEEIAAGHPGAWVEHKPAAAVLHTRPLAPGPAAAATAAALAGPAGLPGVHPIRGNQVVELAVVPSTKGGALVALRAELAGDGDPLPVLYAGDDVTDETALATLGDGDVGIKVGAAESVAPYRVAGPEELASALAVLARERGGRPA
ncbi:trehalose-phosphatase [Pseudactinotalea sp. HY160]|uniref:trehalose-phosphatase n=1 Tax=Pseudactinotalea sp. HY160 TaxID=2654490 RepID=UPI00128B40C6|nr:trehalose-phosphatase [Pseudactinotalea sp. HY160]MPV48452.1 trehalose-phosphatase [Pseudactinotalea sp. HY160]